MSGCADTNAYHSDEEPWLLCCAADTSVTHDADGEPSREACETDGQTSTELDEALV